MTTSPDEERRRLEKLTIVAVCTSIQNRFPNFLKMGSDVNCEVALVD